ncbi:hypothetical protein [Nocardia fusca]|uniref:hypothetical protein n=1 Tax=Nocardia fusca TaxID=941183 RepID=UPI0007A74371|nr:hypothetical protein [Nocardia fusca]
MRTTVPDSVDAILDTGAVGLQYFEVFLPRYREWTGHDPAGGDHFALAAQYDQQRGTDLESLRGIATILAEELEGRLGDQAATQSARFGDLPNHWSGSPAADNARQFLADAGLRIGTNVDTLHAVNTAAGTAVTQIENAVRHKADTAKTEFNAETAAGKTPQQVDWIIDIARGQGDTSDTVQDRLRTELPGYHMEGADPEATCRSWLDEVFVSEIDAKTARFTTLCSDTHTTVTSAYDQLLTAIEAIEPTAFVSPGGAPSADTALTAGQPAYVTAAGLPQAVTADDNEDPAAGQNPARTSSENTEDPGTPSSLALTTTPAAAEISDTAGLGAATNTGVPAVTEDPTNTDSPRTAGDEDGVGLAGSEIGDDSYPGLDGADLGLDDSAATPPAATGTPGVWTPADITGMVTAIGTITGSIPDMITAVGSLAGNLDEIITATGEATAAIIDAADNQPSAPDLGTDDTDLLEEENDTTPDSPAPDTGDDPSDSVDTGKDDDDTTLEEYLNSQASNSIGPENASEESTDTDTTATVAPNTGTPVPDPTHPTVAATPTATDTTSYGSLRGLITTPATRPAKDDHPPQPTPAAAHSTGNHP